MVQPSFPALRSLHTQLACSFALLGAIVAILLAIVLGSRFVQQGHQAAGASLQLVAANSASLLNDGLEHRLREVTALADTRSLWTDGLRSRLVRETLERVLASNPYDAWIGVTDADGIVRAAGGDVLIGVDVRSRPWFAAGSQGGFIGDVHPAKLLAALVPPGRDGGPPRFVDFSAPIRIDGRLIGVIGIHGSWEWTHATIESLLPAPARRDSLEVFVFDAKGHMIFASSGGLAAHVAVGQTLPARTAADTASVPVTRWRDGNDYLTAMAPVMASGSAARLGWTVVARQPERVAHAAASGAAWLALWMAIAASLLSAGFGAWLAGRLTRPLRAIARDARALEAGGEPLALARHRGNLEIEALARALDSMTQRLLQVNEGLEHRVRLRTRELEAANAELERLAHRDGLTGLLNRRGFEERAAIAVASAIRRDAPLSLLVIDADHFKGFNDRHGHEVGDRVLQAIADVLRKRLREVDIVARIGGEEFVVVLTETGSLGASMVAQALVTGVRHAPIGDADPVTISCGVAAMHVGAETLADALRRADAAMYVAKQSGRNRFYVAEDEACESALGRLEMAAH